MKRIMIVDDSIVMRKNLRSILTKAGYTVAADASNGEEAYHIYGQVLPDLIHHRNRNIIPKLDINTR